MGQVPIPTKRGIAIIVRVFNGILPGNPGSLQWNALKVDPREGHRRYFRRSRRKIRHLF